MRDHRRHLANDASALQVCNVVTAGSDFGFDTLAVFQSTIQQCRTAPYQH